MAARPDTSFKVRMDDPLKARIAEAAAANNRSLNAEILHRLENSFKEFIRIGAPEDPAYSPAAQKLIAAAMFEVMTSTDVAKRLAKAVLSRDPGGVIDQVTVKSDQSSVSVRRRAPRKPKAPEKG